MIRSKSALKNKLIAVQLAAVIFLTVSGGPYGLEPLLAYGGTHGALVFLMITPLVWDLPIILAVLEMNSMMPVDGGYYQWVKKALGLRLAFYEGWWTWLYTFADLAIYPVLFVEYAGYFFPGLAAWKIPVCLGLIWISAGMNILGIVPVGKTSLVLGGAVLLPFFLLFVLIGFHHTGTLTIPSASLKGIPAPAMGMALFTVMWNYIGWDNATTYAGEVHRPIKAYMTSIFTAFGIIFIVYFLAIFTAQHAGVSYGRLSAEGFPALGQWVGGHWLGILLAAGGMASTLGIFSAVLLSVSRVPKVMADDGLLPRALDRLHPKWETPYISIIACAAVVSLMVLWTFADLIIIDVTLYGAGLILELVSLIVFRIKMPLTTRPFRIPLPTAGLWLVVILPAVVLGLALTAVLFSSGHVLRPVLFTAGALLSAELIWQMIRIFGKKNVG